MANAYNGKGDLDKAVECWQKAVEIKPDKIETWYNMAVMYYKTGKFDLAIENCNKALEIKPDATVLHQLLRAINNAKDSS